jgi:hypothetical protein
MRVVIYDRRLGNVLWTTLSNHLTHSIIYSVDSIIHVYMFTYLYTSVLLGYSSRFFKYIMTL